MSQICDLLRSRWSETPPELIPELDEQRCLPIAETARLLDKAEAGAFAEPVSLLFSKMHIVGGHAMITPTIEAPTGVVMGVDQ